MKLIKKLSQHRRDFTGLYQCEGCGNEKKVGGCYDDRNYHDNVMPNRKCGKCGKSTNDLGLTPDYIGTKYNDHEVI